MSTIVMTTFGTRGNTVPFLELGTQLLRRGHEVTLCTNAPFVCDGNQAGIPTVGLDSREEYEAFLGDVQLINRPQGLPKVYRRHYIPKVSREVALLSDRIVPGKTVILSADTPGIAARILAEKYQQPLVSVMTYPSNLAGGALLESLVAHKLAPEVNALRLTAGLPNATDLALWWQRPNHYFALWPSWFCRSEAQHFPNTSYLGFLNFAPDAPLPAECQQFLTSNKNVVLVTGGTGGFAAPEFFDLVTAATRRLGIAAILVRPGEVTRLTSNLLLTGTVPSLYALMGHVRAIIHHGGMGTIGQAILARLPQLILADGADRPENGTIVEHLRLGRHLRRPEWNVEAVTRALEGVLWDSDMKQACMAAATSLAQTPEFVLRALELVERLADRASIAQSCAFEMQRRQIPCISRPVDAATLRAVEKLSPERRYWLARTLAERK